MPDPSIAPVGQAPQGTPQPQQQAPQSPTPAPQPVVINEPPQSPQPNPAPAPQSPAAPQNQPTLEQLQQQLQQRDTELQRAAESARYFQSQASRFQNALGQVANGQNPQQPQADALAPYAAQIAALKAKGYDDQAARDTVGLFADMVKPLQQEVQQSRAALQGGMQVDAVMQQVYGSNPQLFANQQVYQETRNAMLAQAMHGGQIDPYQAELTAVSLAYAAAKQAAQGQPTQMPWMPQAQPQPQYQQNPQLPQPFQNGQFNVRPTFQPPTAQPAVVLSPELEKARAEIEARYPKPNTP